MGIKVKKIGIYKITNLINGKMYIGQSRNLQMRWYQHKKSSKTKNYPLYKAMRKYGFDNFKFEILELCSIDELDKKESEYIKKYNTFTESPNSNGYNTTTGGTHTHRAVFGEDVKNKIRKTLTGRKMNISKEGMKRKVDAAKGSNNVNAKTVICDGIEYETIASFSKTFNLNPTTVSTWISGKRTMPAEWANLGLRFKYEETNISKRLSKYSASKNVICEGTVYGTVKECAEHYGINADTMRCWLNGKRTMRKDFIEKGLMYYKEGE